eukprot:gnl/Hemi2/15123_TR5106_c0_g1_i1.p1 gnl/Hemi2/15123_TR5106_c0_g1~~gnl/Hemi2/15123_TR5106_c0_g1_i1.p1  ORF type:complete len:166 (-),score=14.73 gnl/Hemi2/15123_TR5106_c0_g1_i1:354-851(-)
MVSLGEFHQLAYDKGLLVTVEKAESLAGTGWHKVAQPEMILYLLPRTPPGRYKPEELFSPSYILFEDPLECVMQHSYSGTYDVAMRWRQDDEGEGIESNARSSAFMGDVIIVGGSSSCLILWEDLAELPEIDYDPDDYSLCATTCHVRLDNMVQPIMRQPPSLIQ